MRLRLPVCAVLLVSLWSSASAASLTVFAAASLTDALTEVGRAFDRQTGHHTTFQFAGSQVLRTQIEAGAPADVFASANAAQYAPLVKAGRAAPGVIFARNRLTLIAPREGRAVQTLSDLARPGVRLVLAEPAVPVGAATLRFLAAVTRAGSDGRSFRERVLANVVSRETNVRQVALKVQLGEADAGVVYATDVTPALKRAVRVVALPTRFNQTVAYPLGVVRGSRHPQEAQAFVAFVRSAEGQRILRRWGFLAPAP